VAEEYKYLPPKFSYALKDLATDFGVFERADVSSIVSASSNMSMTTASGFNMQFNDQKEVSYPLSPIKEQRSSTNTRLTNPKSPPQQRGAS